jgi:nitroimidazol reductase NimA-like FMN-containing flavoprotein (pyridoxamine 5'-phosphate oxidase superfamily)
MRMTAEAVRELIVGERFMTLATADADGLPWASPVWYAPNGYAEFFWVSSPDVRHSRNLAVRPELAIVIFDSRQTPGDGRAVYMTARAEQTDGEGIEVFNARTAEQGLPAWGAETVLPPARHRLYRATVSEHFVLREDVDERVPVDLEG